MLKLRDSLVKSSTLGWSASDPCQWAHVGCTNNRVDRIQIGYQNLQGKLPPELRNLTQLTRFEVMSNNLTGSLPSLSGLSSLQVLLLHSNNFSSIPPDFFTGMTSLTSVSLDTNPFESWEIPESLKDATSLKEFSANEANVAGKIPESFNNDVFPGLESLHLAFNYLEGELPLNFSGSTIRSLWLNGQKSNSRLNGTLSILQNMTSLTEIACVGKDILELFLSDNMLTGTIPDELTNLSDLTILDVSNNRLYGNIPKFRNNVQVEYAGNPDIGKNGRAYPPPGTPGTAPGSPSGTVGDSDGSGNKNLATGKIVGSVIGVVCGLCMVGLGVFFYNRKQKRSSKVQRPNMMIIHPRHSGDQDAVKITVAGSSANIGAESFTDSVGPSDIHLVRTENMVISIQVLRNVTNNFSEENILGRGGFGTVYKGELHDGTKIAVKRMESGVVSEKGLAEFMSEIAVLTKVRHRHLVALIGYCLDGNERLLVYEYMPQVTGRVTTKVDVFSFGVILMEMITGRKALDETQPEDSLHLVTWFRRMHINKDTFRKAIDPTINLDEETLGSISTVAELAGHCTAREPYQRPDMGHVVNVLSSLTEIWKAAEPDSDDMYGIDFETPLPEVLLKWQAFDGSSSSFLPNGDNTQTSIPTRPSGFAESFTSADGR
ncbi:hypothetical protein H0E87_015692 [Populus deltoides]|uniref:Protein kinase domain-containing protein n=1 Tax=Populus deltoides TaxID=3696 RepID=A0A8T2Y650_POPDE|nr:hypothetical protein H0E87_015692 [Populus deltoides]